MNDDFKWMPNNLLDDSNIYFITLQNFLIRVHSCSKSKTINTINNNIGNYLHYTEGK